MAAVGVLTGGVVSSSDVVADSLPCVTVSDEPSDTVWIGTLPPAQWPGRVQRDYRYARRDLPSYRITLDCVFTRVARERIEIVEVSYDLVRMGETCTNADRQVENTYWVQEATGFVWKSEQWIGPETGHATIEVVRPYAG